MSQDLQANFQNMISEGKFSLGLKALQKTITMCKNPVINYGLYDIISLRCQKIFYKVAENTPEINKITRSDLEDFNEKTDRLYNIIQEIRDREKIAKILEARNDYDLVKQAQWDLDVLDRNFKISSKEQIYRQSLEILEQQCQKTKQLDEYQSKLLQLLAFFNKDQNKITKNMEVTEEEKMVLRKLGEIYKHSGEKVIEFYQQKKAGILYELKEKYIEEIQNFQEQNENYQKIFNANKYNNQVYQQQNYLQEQKDLKIQVIQNNQQAYQQIQHYDAYQQNQDQGQKQNNNPNTLVQPNSNQQQVIQKDRQQIDKELSKQNKKEAEQQIQQQIIIIEQDQKQKMQQYQQQEENLKIQLKELQKQLVESLNIQQLLQRKQEQSQSQQLKLQSDQQEKEQKIQALQNKISELQTKEKENPQ